MCLRKILNLNLAKQLLLLLAVYVCFVTNLFAQPDQPIRLELEASPNTDEFEIIPLPDSSLLVYKHSFAFFSKPEIHSFSKYDSHLTSNWNVQPQLPSEHKLTGYHTDGNRIYLLFLPRKTDKLLVMILNTKTAAHVLYEYKAPEAVQVLDFQVLGNFAFLTVHDERNYVRLLHINLSENKGDFLPAVFATTDAFCDLNIDEATMRAEVVLSENYGNKARLQVRRFTPDGKLLSTNFIFDRKQYNIRDGRLFPGDSSRIILVGTFGNRDLRYHQGLFSTVLSDPDQNLNFYKFIDFTHFFDYMAPRTKRRILKKIDRLKSRNTDYLVRTRLFLHKPIPHPNGYYLVAEAYAIQYNYQPGIESIRQGIPTRVFNGYRRTAAIVCNFSKTGELLWENSYPIRDITTFELYPTIAVGFGQDTVYLAYLNEDDRIKYKSIYKAESSSNDLETDILTYHRTEKTINTSSGKLQSWYGANFVVHGFQRIRSENKPTRQVYFINKLSFSDQLKPEQP